TAAFEVMFGRPCYEVVFSDGSRLVADAEHEWVTCTHRDRLWAGRRRSGAYLDRNFALRASLDQLRSAASGLSESALLTRRQAEALAGGHSWSVGRVARALTSDHGLPQRY